MLEITDINTLTDRINGYLYTEDPDEPILIIGEDIALVESILSDALFMAEMATDNITDFLRGKGLASVAEAYGQFPDGYERMLPLVKKFSAEHHKHTILVIGVPFKTDPQSVSEALSQSFWNEGDQLDSYFLKVSYEDWKEHYADTSGGSFLVTDTLDDNPELFYGQYPTAWSVLSLELESALSTKYFHELTESAKENIIDQVIDDILPECPEELRNELKMNSPLQNV